MKRAISHVCRLLVKKVKQLFPLLLIACAFIFITRDQVTTSQNVFNPLVQGRRIKGHNSSLPLRTRTLTSKRAVIQKQATVKPHHTIHTNYSNRGERIAAQTRDVCQKFQTLSQKIPLTVRWSKNNNLLFCPIYKVGTTFWRRVFMIQREEKYSKFENPYLLPFDKEYAGSNFIWKRNVTIPQYKVMFTRDPYNRLYSFYVDKMLAPNPYFWKSVGAEVAVLTRGVQRKQIRKVCGHDITFPEFIKYAIHTLETGKKIDPHWIEMEKNCHPCEMNYDFIGQMENFNEDSIQILQKLGLTKMASFLDKSGKDASVDDAIRDTLSQPFSFRSRYRTCMTFKDAVLRAWQKLQIRGLIGKTTLEGFVINEKTTKIGDLISRARASRNSSTTLERTEIKNKMYKELWNHVNTSDLFKLKELYSKDFKLFEYDSVPSALFQLRTDT